MGKKEIASKLKQARINANMTQREVANILGMTYQAISNYERGKTKVESDILIKLCKIYNVSVPEILSDTSEENDIDPLLSKIGFRIKQRRENLGLTLEEVGDYIGVNRATVQRYESGNIDIKRNIAIKLSEILKTTPSYIMGWDEPELSSHTKKIAVGFEKDNTQNEDKRLQEIIHCYNNMTDEGKNLLLGQAQFYHQQFIKPKANARAM